VQRYRREKRTAKDVEKNGPSAARIAIKGRVNLEAYRDKHNNGRESRYTGWGAKQRGLTNENMKAEVKRKSPLRSLSGEISKPLANAVEGSDLERQVPLFSARTGN